MNDEANLFPSVLLLPCSPYTSDELIAWNHGAREPRLELLDVGRITATKGLDDLVARGVPRVQSVHDGTAKAHLGTWLRRGMQRVVIAVQAIQESRLLGRLVLQHKVRLLVLGWREVHRLGALGSAPSALRDIEGAGADARVDLAIAHINQVGLGVNHTAGLALVVNSNDLCSELELLARRGCGEGLEELDFALAVDDAGWIEFGNVGDLDGFLGGVEVDYILGSALEDFAIVSNCCRSSLGKQWGHLTKDGRVCREDLEPGVELLEVRQYRMEEGGGGIYVEEVQLLISAANGVCEEQNIALQPRHFLGRVFKANSWSRHGGYSSIVLS